MGKIKQKKIGSGIDFREGEGKKKKNQLLTHSRMLRRSSRGEGGGGGARHWAAPLLTQYVLTNYYTNYSHYLLLPVQCGRQPVRSSPGHDKDRRTPSERSEKSLPVPPRRPLKRGSATARRTIGNHG